MVSRRRLFALILAACSLPAAPAALADGCRSSSMEGPFLAMGGVTDDRRSFYGAALAQRIRTSNASGRIDVDYFDLRQWFDGRGDTRDEFIALSVIFMPEPGEGIMHPADRGSYAIYIGAERIAGVALDAGRLRYVISDDHALVDRLLQANSTVHLQLGEYSYRWSVNAAQLATALQHARVQANDAVMDFDLGFCVPDSWPESSFEPDDDSP
jgi:hypothetical protein